MTAALRSAGLQFGALALLGALAVSACAHTPPPARASPPVPSACRHDRAACTEPAPDFARAVEPVLQQHCFKCHMPPGEPSASADADGAPSRSVLLARPKLVSEVIGACIMPPSPEHPLADADAETLLRWAACGGTQ